MQTKVESGNRMPVDVHGMFVNNIIPSDGVKVHHASAQALCPPRYFRHPLAC